MKRRTFLALLSALPAISRLHKEPFPLGKRLPVNLDSSKPVLIWKDTGKQSTSQLIAYIDTETGMPVTPNGGNIGVSWDSVVNRIFKI